ncbi:MAG: indolepyruvate ferredoxin oxidoreductase subunit alpha [Christensenellales bacterium]|jgi:indolepyruvate ferredoxin oxidoreductase alpha subunit
MDQLMLSNQAIARGAWEAGVRVVSSYPGTPSTEITEAAAKLHGPTMHVEWAPNEKVALEVGAGASISGGRAMVCMKHVGLNVAADPLFTVAYTGVNGGLVIVVADDPAMHSSQNEQDSRFYARSAHIPMLEPADSDEALRFTRMAFDLSEQYDTPVLIRTTTRVAHSQSVVRSMGERREVALKPYVKDIAKYVMMPAQAKGRHVAVEARENRLKRDANTLSINQLTLKGDQLGVICSGAVYQYVTEALPEASVLKLGMVYPLPMDLIADFAKKVKRLVVVEELEPFFQDAILAAGIPVEGKNLFSLQGELSASIIAEKLGQPYPELVAEPLPARPPVLCPGCPHRATFYAIHKRKLKVTGDIGCYTLGALAPLSSIDACICMGASVGMAHGMEKARGEAFGHEVVGVIGDSTFIHSGITGLINAVYNQSGLTLVILDNSTTGMTGHQEHPATGKNIYELPAPKLDLEQLVRAVGVKRVVTVDPYDLKAMDTALKEETESGEVSVIIARRPCALLDKSARKQPLTINAQACKNCKSCLNLGCPAIENREGGLYINPALCNGCGLCTKVCPFHAIEEVQA